MAAAVSHHGEFYRVAGLVLRAKRQEVGLSQDGLAEPLGLTQTGLWFIETGRSRLRLDTLIKACAVMQVDPVELLKDIIRLTDVPRETSRSKES